MAAEDLSTWTETDPSAILTISPNTKVAFAGLAGDEVALLEKDGGASAYDDFTHHGEVEITAHGGYSIGRLGIQMYSNSSGGLTAGWAAGLGVTWGDDTKNLLALEYYDWGWTEDAYAGAEDTRYYYKVSITGTTLTVEIYSDSSRTTLLDTLTNTLGEDTAYRYAKVCPTWDDSDPDNITGDVSNVDFAPGGGAPAAGPEPIVAHMMAQLRR